MEKRAQKKKKNICGRLDIVCKSPKYLIRLSNALRNVNTIVIC